MDNIIFEQLTKLSSSDTEAIGNLAAQFGDGYKFLTEADMQEMLDSPDTNILVARDSENKKVVGMVTVFVHRIPYDKKAYIEDFIVDKSYRDRGIGTQLFKNAIDLAKKKGATHVDFTSNPKRLEANKLYEKLGFEKRDTNVYRLIIEHAET